MTFWEKINLKNTFIKINLQDNIKKENTLKNKYFNSVFDEYDANDFSETLEGLISNLNSKLSKLFN